jgi:hypothetical protein
MMLFYRICPKSSRTFQSQLRILKAEHLVDALTTLATTMGLGFAAGLRLYATVLGLGLALRFDLLHLPASMRELDILAHPAVLIGSGLAFVIEFISDKIPWVDSVWDAVHTFVRPVGAAVLAATAFANIDPLTKWMLILLCGGVALSAHTTKAATRLAVNQSPEPFSNWGLSLLGDVATPAVLWLTATHPLLVLGFVLTFLVAFVWVFSRLLRWIRSGLARWRDRDKSQSASAAGIS